MVWKFIYKNQVYIHKNVYISKSSVCFGGSWVPSSRSPPKGPLFKKWVKTQSFTCTRYINSVQTLECPQH